MGWFNDKAREREQKRKIREGKKELGQLAGVALLPLLPIILPIHIIGKLLGGSKKKKR